jgi:hypothetical protein
VKFDDYWEDSAAAADNSQQQADKPMLPDATHVGEIKWCGEKEKAFAKDADKNPRGKCLTVLVEVTGYEPVFVDLPVHWRGLIEAVCRSARVDRPVKGEEWDEQVLKGKYVTIETVQNVSNSTGRQYVRVQKWKPGTELPPKQLRDTKPRSAAQKAHRHVQEAGDDIPF